MSGGIINKNNPLRLLSVIVAAVCVFGYSAFGAAKSETAKAASVPQAAKAVATQAAPVAKAANTPAAKTQTKTLTPPPMVGAQTVAAPDKAKGLVPDKKSMVPQVKSFSEALKDAQKGKKADAKKPQQKKKVVKVRKQVIDLKVVAWGRSLEDAESLAYESSRKIVGSKDNYLVKDSIFILEATKKIICTLRINYTDEIPETWYLESEMVTGFGKNYEKAYADAMQKAIAKAKIVQNTADWKTANSNIQSASELGVVTYDFVFAGIGTEKYCKLFFRYMRPR